MKSPHKLSIHVLLFSVAFFSQSLVKAAEANIKTINGNEWGVSLSSYAYEEPSLGMSIKGDKLGLNHLGTKLLDEGWFVKDDVRWAFGAVNYVGSGYQSGVPDWYVDARVLLGQDIGEVGFSSFVGMGYRYLFNDLRGYSSSGAIGYRRESNYFYIPVGLTHRFVLQDSAVFATTLEFDQLLFGRQVSKLSDLVGHAGYTSASDITNIQTSGLGIRLDVMYEMDDLAWGPFFHTWHISQSGAVLRPLTQNGASTWYNFSEPRNHTREFGLRMRSRF